MKSRRHHDLLSIRPARAYPRLGEPGSQVHAMEPSAGLFRALCCPPRDRQSWVLWVAAVLALAVGLSIRVSRIGRDGIWVDEASSVLLAEQDVESLFVSHTTTEPPLYHLMLHHWKQLGRDLRWLRIPTLVAGSALVFVVAWTARHLYGHNGALWALLLCSLSPMLIAQSQEIRCYAMLAPLAALSHGFLLVAWVRGRMGRCSAVVITVSLACCLWMHYSAIGWALGLLTATVAMGRIGRKSLLPISTALLLFLPIVPLFLQQVHLVQTGFWVAKLSVRGVFSVLVRSMSGRFVAPVCGIIVIACFHRRARRLLTQQDWLVPVVAALPAVVIIMGAVVFSVLVSPVLHPRIVSIMVPAILLAMAGLASILRPRVQSVLAVGVLISSLWTAAFHVVNRVRDNEVGAVGVRASFDFIVNHLSEADVVVHDSIFTYLPFSVYYDSAAKQYLSVRRNEWYYSGQWYRDTRRLQSLKELPCVPNRLWYIAQLSDPVAETFLDGFRMALSRTFDGGTTWVSLWERWQENPEAARLNVAPGVGTTLPVATASGIRVIEHVGGPSP